MMYGLGLLLDFMLANGGALRTIVRIELVFNSGLEHLRQPTAVRQAVAGDPNEFVRLYNLAHFPDGRIRNPGIWFFIGKLRLIQGASTDGIIDSDILSDWVERARQAFDQQGCGPSGDEMIGSLLAGSPSGDDGAWPAEAVRDVLDAADAKHLRYGFLRGVFNDRGLTVRASYDGGEQEGMLADQHERWAREIAIGWPRVAAMLREHAESVRRQAKHHDARADETQDEP